MRLGFKPPKEAEVFDCSNRLMICSSLLGVTISSALYYFFNVN